MTMKLIKMVGVVLLSFFIMSTAVTAEELEAGRDKLFSIGLKYDDAAHTITSHNAKIAFSEAAGTVEIKIVMANVTAVVTKGAGESFSVRGTSNTTGEIITMTPKEYKVLSQLMATVDFSRWDDLCDNFLYSALNLLQSWPPTMPVLIISGDGKLMYMNQRGDTVVTDDGESYGSHLVCPEGKELEFVPDAYDNLCAYKRSTVQGHYLVYGEWDWTGSTREAWTEPFSEYLDDCTICNGRCGIGCTMDTIALT